MGQNNSMRWTGGVMVLVLFFLPFLPLGRAQSSGSDITIRLKDGSVIKGQVLGQEGDKLRIMSTSLGLVAVKVSDIAGMEGEKGDGAAAVSSSGIPPAQAKQLQDIIMNNPQTMQSIEDLTKNKDVMDIVSDPQIKDAIARQDLEYLRNNEKFNRFMNNPTVKGIVQNTTQAADVSSQGAEDGRQSQN